MITILRREFKAYFSSPIGYIILAAFWALAGVYFYISVIYTATAEMRPVFKAIGNISIFLIPLMTMRMFSEDKRQRTEQALLTAPLSLWELVLGKFRSGVCVYAINVSIVLVYGLTVSAFAPVEWPVIIGLFLGTMMYGSTMIAIGMFISSLTESQAFACGVGIAALVANYYLVSLAQTISENKWGALIAFIVIAIAVAGVVYYMTKNSDIAFGVGIVLVAAIGVAFWINNDIFKGLLPKVMREVSLFTRFTTFVNGVFDLTAIIFYLSVVAFFLFLTVQSLEKRRYN